MKRSRSETQNPVDDGYASPSTTLRYTVRWLKGQPHLEMHSNFRDPEDGSFKPESEYLDQVKAYLTAKFEKYCQQDSSMSRSSSHRPYDASHKYIGRKMAAEATSSDLPTKEVLWVLPSQWDRITGDIFSGIRQAVPPYNETPDLSKSHTLASKPLHDVEDMSTEMARVDLPMTIMPFIGQGEVVVEGTELSTSRRLPAACNFGSQNGLSSLRPSAGPHHGVEVHPDESAHPQKSHKTHARSSSTSLSPAQPSLARISGDSCVKSKYQAAAESPLPLRVSPPASTQNTLLCALRTRNRVPHLATKVLPEGSMACDWEPVISYLRTRQYDYLKEDLIAYGRRDGSNVRYATLAKLRREALPGELVPFNASIQWVGAQDTSDWNHQRPSSQEMAMAADLRTLATSIEAKRSSGRANGLFKRHRHSVRGRTKKESANRPPWPPQRAQLEGRSTYSRDENIGSEGVSGQEEQPQLHLISTLDRTYHPDIRSEHIASAAPDTSFARSYLTSSLFPASLDVVERPSDTDQRTNLGADMRPDASLSAGDDDVTLDFDDFCNF